MNKPKIVRLPDSQPARALWYDRKKYVTINFMVQEPTDVQIDVQDHKLIISCKSEENGNIYNELEFYDKVLRFDCREKIFDRSINLLIRKITPDVAWPRLTKDTVKPSWIAVDFDNWRDWATEEDEGMAEYEQYMDMIQDISSKKGEAPAMDDLDDLSD